MNEHSSIIKIHKPGSPRYQIAVICRDVIIFASLVTITVFLFQPLHKKMVEYITALRDSFIEYAQEFLGRSIYYSSIRPFLSHCDIYNVAISGPQSDSEPTVSISSIRLSYSILDLLRGLKLKALRKVSLNNPIININAEQDSDLINRLLLPQEGALDILNELNERFSLTIKNAGLSFVQAKQGIALDDLEGDLSLNKNEIALRAKVKAQAGTVQESGSVLSLQTALQINASSTSDLQSAQAALSISSLSVFSSGETLVQVKEIDIEAAMQEGSVIISKQNDRLPFSLYAGYDMQSKALYSKLECNNFAPSSLLSLGASLKYLNVWLESSLKGRAEFYKDSENLYYGAEMTGLVPPKVIGEPFSLSIVGSGDSERINIVQMLCKVPQGNVQFQGNIFLKPFLPDGTLSITDFSLSGNELCNAVFTFSTKDNTFSLKGQDAFIGKVPLSTVKAYCIAEKENLVFNLSALRPKEGGVGEISVDGSFDYENHYLDLSLSFDSWELLDIADMAEPFVDMSSITLPKEIIRALDAQSQIFIATDFKQVSFNVPSFVLEYKGNQPMLKGAFISAAFSGTETRIALDEVSIGNDEHKFAMKGDLDFADINTVGFNFDASYQNIPYKISGTLLDRRSLIIQGIYNLLIQVESDSGAYAGYVEADSLPILYKGQLGRVSITSSFRYDSKAAWHLDLNNLEIQDLAFPLSNHSSIVVSGNVSQSEIALNRISFDDGQGSLNGSASASWSNGFSYIRGSLNLSNETESEYYSFSGNREDKHIVFHLDGNNMRPGRFVADAYNALLSGGLDVVWDSKDSYQILTNITSLTGTIEGALARASGRVVIDNNTVSIEDFNAEYIGLRVGIPHLYTNRSEGSIDTSAKLDGKFIGWDIGANLKINVEYKPVDSWTDIETLFSVFHGSIAAHEGRFSQRPVSTEPFYFEFDHRDSILSISGGPRDMIRLKLFDTGDLYIGLSAPSAIRGAITGTVINNEIEAQISNVYVDLGSLWTILPPEWQQLVNIQGGFITAESVQVIGPLADPEFFGSAKVHSLRMQVPLYLEHDIRPTPFTVVFNGSDMFFNKLFASIGEGVASATGSFKFDRWVPDVFDIDINVQESTNPVPFKTAINGIHAKGNASGSLTLSMDKDLFIVKGDLIANDTEVTVNADELEQQESVVNRVEAVNTIIDLVLRTGSKVQFLWPDEKNPIIQANAGAGNSLLIKTDTGSGRFSLVGNVKIQGGTILYTPRSFYIREGELIFNENEVHIAPKLSVRAELRDRNDSGPVTIRMILDNVSLSDIKTVEPRWESDPPLSQMDIVALLGHDLTGNPDEGTGSLVKSVIAASADVLSQFQLIRVAEQSIRDLFKLDMFTIRTQVLQNMALQSLGLRTITDGTSIIGSYFDNTTIFFGKYLKQDMFVHAMIRTRYDDGRNREGLRLGGLVFEPELGLELGTVLNLGIFGNPRLDIRGNIIPLHPENLFVNDLTFTFLFNWSF